MSKVTFIGLGVMGYPMAGHLARAGHDVTVYNRTAAKADAWVKQHGGRAAPTPQEAATGAEIVFACVGNDDDLREVTAGENGAFHSMGKGTIFVDHTTASAAVARDLCEEAKARGISFIDAPVSGGQAGAENGVLTVMVGGDEAAFAEATACDRCLCADGEAARAVGRRAAHQDGATRLPLPVFWKACRKRCALPRRASLISIRSMTRFRAVRRKAGRWTIAGQPWRKMNLTLVLQWTGCAKISAWPWKKHEPMAQRCQ